MNEWIFWVCWNSVFLLSNLLSYYWWVKTILIGKYMNYLCCQGIFWFGTRHYINKCALVSWLVQCDSCTRVSIWRNWLHCPSVCSDNPLKWNAEVSGKDFIFFISLLSFVLSFWRHSVCCVGRVQYSSTSLLVPFYLSFFFSTLSITWPVLTCRYITIEFVSILICTSTIHLEL